MNRPEREEEPRLDELRALPRELEPPPELERRVIGALRERGLLVSDAVSSTVLSAAPGGASPARPAAARPAPGPARWAALAAACLVAFAAGWFGRSLALEPATPGAADDRPRFLLLLSEPGAAGELPPDELGARVEEYRAWAHGLASRGLLEGADRLEPRAIRLDRAAGGGGDPVGRGAPAGDDPGAVSGFFLIRAADLDHALGIAGTCPHLRHGGRITVRPIAG
jgi:hypothetical protein